MRISLVTATYRCAPTIGGCLRSAAAQSHPDLEHVVVDGASPDGTLAEIERHRARLAVVVSETDRGLYDALNKGIARCSGDVVGFLHADDVFADEHALARVAAAFADPDVDACYGDLVYVAAEDTDRVIRYWRAGDYAPRRLRLGWMPPHPTFYVRRSLYERLGGFDTGFRIAADYECMLRLLGAATGRVAYVPEVQVRMRVGGMSNRSIGNIWRKSREDYRAIRRHGVGGIGTLLCKNLSKLGQFAARPPERPEKP